jgi:hypothetical protein
VSPAEQELWDDEARLEKLGLSAAEIAEAIALLRQADDYRRTQRGWDELQTALTAARERPWFPHLDKFPLVLPREAPAWGSADLDYDPRPTLERLAVPVLAILGREDESTPSEDTAARIRAALDRASTEDVTIEVLPDADHGFLPGALGGGVGLAASESGMGRSDGRLDRHSGTAGAPVAPGGASSRADRDDLLAGRPRPHDRPDPAAERAGQHRDPYGPRHGRGDP